jgi:hypothetical protein
LLEIETPSSIKIWDLKKEPNLGSTPKMESTSSLVPFFFAIVELFLVLKVIWL